MIGDVFDGIQKSKLFRTNLLHHQVEDDETTEKNISEKRKMRSAKESGCFPYGSKLVCFMELWPNGDLIQLSSKHEKREACFHAMGGKSKVVAVWPGNWRSDLFIVDDLEAFLKYQL